MKDVKDKPAFDRCRKCRKFGVFIVDGEGLAVRCFDERKKAFNWIRKHWPELKPAEARTRIRTFGAYWQVRRVPIPTFSWYKTGKCGNSFHGDTVFLWAGFPNRLPLPFSTGKKRFPAIGESPTNLSSFIVHFDKLRYCPS